MKPLLVLDNPQRWPLTVDDGEKVRAADYLLDPRYSEMRGVRVYNLCRSYSYQSVGYYVSLLAAARGHRPLPSVATLQDLRLLPLLRIVGEDLDATIQRALAPLKSDRFELSIYFGKNVAKQYDRLSRALYNQYPAPMLRASFVREGRWELRGIRPIATSEMPQHHRDFFVEQARRHFRRPRGSLRMEKPYRYDLAILYNPEEQDSPSDDGAIRKFVRAARQVGLNPSVIDREDYGRLAEYDALFIRETTYVNHHTFRMSRRAAAEGLVVIDDPDSILRCTNKVYLAELFTRNDVPAPRTLVIDEADTARILSEVGLPCVLKRPDSSFSQGVLKAETAEDLARIVSTLFEKTELAVAQEFLASSYDWRIGILGGDALWACKYHMAPGHWQIISRDAGGRTRFGRVETVSLDQVPPRCLNLARRSARLIGDGLYGVDIKQVGRRFYVMEINDNPSIDSGCEDAVIGDQLYLAVMRFFRERLDRRGARDSHR